MGSLPKSLLVAVAVILGLCAVAGFGMGLTSTFARRAVTAEEEQTPIAAVPAGVTIKDAQPLPPPPPPPPPKPKAAVTADAASSQAPSEAAPGVPPAKTAPPTESAPGAPPGLTPPPPRAPTAPLPNDLPPT
jgi:hypothetical protein